MAPSTWGKLKQGFFMPSEIHQYQQSLAESLLPGTLHHSDQSRIYKELHFAAPTTHWHPVKFVVFIWPSLDFCQQWNFTILSKS